MTVVVLLFAGPPKYMKLFMHCACGKEAITLNRGVPLLDVILVLVQTAKNVYHTVQ